MMCEAMRRLMKDEIQEGILKTLFSLVKDGILSIADVWQSAPT